MEWRLNQERWLEARAEWRRMPEPTEVEPTVAEGALPLEGL